MQVSLVISSPLTLDLSAITPNPELGERYAIIRQLFARRSWSADPKELLNADGKLNLQVPLPDIWNNLTRLEKVAALFQSRGFKATCALLPSLQQGTEEELARRLSAYRAEVEALTGGVMTAPAIPHYLALRNFLLADATAFTELFQKVGQRLKLFSFDEKGNRGITKKAIQEGLPVNLRFLCILIDSACFSNNLEDLEKAKDPLTACSDIIEGCREAFEKLRGEVELRSFFERIDRASKCFQLWKRAFHDPLHLLPVLLFPIQAQNVSSVDFRVENQDQVNLGDASAGWLNDCLIVCQRSTEDVLKAIRKSQGQSKKIETACTKAIQSLQEWNNEIGREIHLLSDLQRSSDKEKQLHHLIDRVQKCSSRLKELELNYFGPLYNQVLQFISADSFIGRQLFNRPRRIHSLIAHGVVSSLMARAEQMLKVHKLMTGFCSPELQERSSLYTPMDVLDLQVRESLEQFSLDAVQGVEGEKLRKVKACLFQLTTTVSQFIDSMRSDWNSPTLDFASRSRAFDRVLLFRPLVKRLLGAIKEMSGLTDKEPGLHSCTTVVTLLGELVMLDCWPRLLSCGLPVKPFMEKQTMLRLFSYSLRDFVRDDLKGVCCQWDFPWLANAPHLRKRLQSKSDSIKQFLKELQTELRQKPELSLDNFESNTSQWFSKLTKTIARIQQREEEMFQALDAHPEFSAHYDEMCDKIRSARQIVERCFFTLNRGLISDLLSRQLIEEEKKAKPIVSTDFPVEENEEEKEEDIELQVVAPVSAPAAAPPAQRVIETPHVLFKKLFDRCQRLYEQHEGFVLSSKEHKLQFLHQFQGDAINNLIHTAHCLRELVMRETQSNRPVCVSEIHLRLAVLLEQASKLALSLKGVTTSVGNTSQLLVKTGREGWRWQEHNPLHYCQALEQAGAVSLTPEQMGVIKRLERVIEVSSRYPYSGRDSHLIDLRQAMAHRLDQQKPRTLLQRGLESCLSILDSVCEQSVERPESSPPYDLQKLGKYLQEFQISETSDENKLKNEAERLLHTMQQRVKALNLYRFAPQCREVEAVGEGDPSKRQREGTIETALNNIASILDLSSDILLGPDEPDLCLTLASAGLRQQAVLLELAALIQLAQGAYPSVGNPSQHYLFAEGDAPIKRYSHDLSQFAEILHFSKKWQGVCARLTPYLRSGYRYEGFEGLNTFKMLSLLRDRLATGQITVNESILLKSSLQIEDSQKQLDLLNRGIIQMFRAEIKKPLIETLKHVDTLLQRYEEQMVSRLNV